MSTTDQYPQPVQNYSYPPLPGAGPAFSPAGATLAEHVSFIFPGDRTFNHPWRRSEGALYREEESGDVIEFYFAVLAAFITFAGADRSLAQACWQTYLDGRLANVTDQPGVCEIEIRYERISDDFTHTYPSSPAKGKRPEVSEEDVFP